MLPLGSADLPVDAASLADSIARGFATLFDTGPATFKVDAGNSKWPAVEAIAIDLTGARAKLDVPVGPDLNDVGDEFELTAGSIRLLGKPIKIDSGNLTLELATRSARIRIWRERSGRSFWAVSSAGTGRIHLDFLTRELEALLMSVLSPIVQKHHGITVKKIELRLKPIDDRSLETDVVITAAKSFLTAVLRVGGRLSIDDHLNARLDNITCRGDGMIGSAAAAMIKPKLESTFEKPIPLATVLGPGIRLSEAKLSVTDRVAVDAKWE
jgi:hypothetical protein